MADQTVEEEQECRGPPVPVNERYFTKYFTPKGCVVGVEGSKPLDQCVLYHSNKICVVCIAPSHPIVTDDSIEIESIDFHNGSFDLSKNKVYGKRKRGGHRLLPESALCQVQCKGDVKFIFRSCVKGYLVEVNDRLQANTNLLKTKPLSEGYLAILTQKLSHEFSGNFVRTT